LEHSGSWLSRNGKTGALPMREMSATEFACRLERNRRDAGTPAVFL
jgi:hypothetical protein